MKLMISYIKEPETITTKFGERVKLNFKDDCDRWLSCLLNPVQYKAEEWQQGKCTPEGEVIVNGKYTNFKMLSATAAKQTQQADQLGEALRFIKKDLIEEIQKAKVEIQDSITNAIVQLNGGKPTPEMQDRNAELAKQAAQEVLGATEYDEMNPPPVEDPGEYGSDDETVPF